MCDLYKSKGQINRLALLVICYDVGDFVLDYYS